MAPGKKGHAAHHASNGNLDRRGQGDVETLTVAEYRALTPLKRLGYRLYRNPFIMVLLGAPINFILLQRLPTGASFRDRAASRSILLLNVALVVVFGLPMAVIGVVPVLATYLPVMIIASWIGNWLFYVQHQFEGTYWEGMATGISMPPPFAAALISSYRSSCDGSAAISACTMSITCAAVFRIITCRPVSTRPRNCAVSPSG